MKKQLTKEEDDMATLKREPVESSLDRKELISELLDRLWEHPHTEEDVAQLGVMLRALEMFHRREEKYNGLWRKDGAIDSAFHAKHKATRVWSRALDMVAGADEDVEDAIDLINYAVFFIRNVGDGRLR